MAEVAGGGAWYPPHMERIPFPTGAASEAKAVCERIAGMLDRDLGARPAMVEAARDGWEGVYRNEFDDTWRIQ